MWLHYKWRELLWSMSWLRPGDKFDKCTYLSKTKFKFQFNIDTKESLDFKMGLQETPGYVDNLPKPIYLIKEGKFKWQHQTQK